MAEEVRRKNGRRKALSLIHIYIAIGSVPLPDLSAIDVVDFNTDVEQAVGNSSSVQNARHQSAGTATEISVKSDQESQAELCIRDRSGCGHEVLH